MTVTITDISRRLGLSISTVSKALNGYADVSPQTRKLVMQTAQELGYHPSAAVRSLRRGRTDKIGLMVNNSISYMTDYIAEIVPGAAYTAEQYDKNLVFYTNAVHSEDAVRRICRSREIDGVILITSAGIEQVIDALLQERFPFVVLGRRVAQREVWHVAPDNVTGAKLLTQHLLSLGHRRIGFMARTELGTTHLDRLGGYVEALGDADIPIDEKLIVPTYIQPDSGYDAMHEILNRANPPTAVFAFHDFVAADALRYALDHGCHVPDDVAIVGFNGLKASMLTQPPLTTVEVPLQAMGALAVELLLKRINDPNAPSEQHIVPVKLLARASTVPTVMA